MAPAPYCIILQHCRRDDWMRVADTLVSAIGIPRADAAKASRRGFGLILLPLNFDQAEAAAAALTQAGLPAKSVASEQFVRPPDALAMVYVVPDGDVLRCLRIDGAAFELPANAIRIVHAGYVLPAKQRSEKAALLELELQERHLKTNNESSDLATGMAVGAMVLGGPTALGFVGAAHLADSVAPQNDTPPAAAPKTPEVCVDLVSAAPLLRLRFTQRKYDYKTLGPRLLPNMRGNFKLVINDLLAALPAAIPIGQAQDAARGANLEQEKFIREDADLALEMTAILTREKQFGAT